jgi:hypothetical protein
VVENIVVSEEICVREKLFKNMSESKEFHDLNKLRGEFNPLEMMLGSEKENSISKILSSLCNPHLKHNFGSKFLQEFLKNILPSKKLCPEKYKISIKTEFSFGDSGRIDILINFLNKDNEEEHVIGIENKTKQDEGEEQICKYQKGLINSFPDSNKIIVYLTPYGKKSETIDELLTDRCPVNISSYESIIKSCNKKYNNIDKYEQRFLNDFSLFVKDKILGIDMYKKENEKSVINLAKVYKEEVGKIIKYGKQQNNIRRVVYENLLRDLMHEGHVIPIGWHFPNTQRPQEFNFEAIKINRELKLIEAGEFPYIYFQITSNTGKPDIGDSFTFRVMAFCYNTEEKNEVCKFKSNLIDVILSSCELPNDKTKKREWIPWRCLWSGDEYILQDIGELDNEGLFKIINDGIGKTQNIIIDSIREKHDLINN